MNQSGEKGVVRTIRLNMEANDMEESNSLWKLGFVIHFIYKNFGLIFVGFIMAMTWIQMFPCVFGLDTAIEIEPMTMTDPDSNPLVTQVGNLSQSAILNSYGILYGPTTFFVGILLFVMTMYYVSPICVMAFYVFAGIATAICVAAQTYSLYTNRCLEVLPVVSYIPAVYVRVNVFQLALIAFLFGPQLVKRMCMTAPNDDDDDEEAVQREVKPSTTPYRAATTAPGKDLATSGLGKKLGRFVVCTNNPTFPLQKTTGCNDVKEGGEKIGKNVVKAGKNKGKTNDNTSPAAIKSIINVSQMKSNFQAKDCKVQTVESKYGTNYYIGFPDYPPVIKPDDGCPKKFPSPIADVSND